MIHALQATLDLTGLLFAVGIATYGVSISRYLKGGSIQHPFLVLAGASILAVVGESVDVIWSLGWGPDVLDQVHAVTEVLFLAFVMLAMLLVCKTWRSLNLTTRE